MRWVHFAIRQKLLIGSKNNARGRGGVTKSNRPFQSATILSKPLRIRR